MDDARESEGVCGAEGNIDDARDRDDIRGRSGAGGAKAHPNMDTSIAVSDGSTSEHSGADGDCDDGGVVGSIGLDARCKLIEWIVDRSELSWVDV